MGCGGSKNLPRTQSLSPLPNLSTPSDLISALPSLSIPYINLEDYEILTHLASGGIGIVYSAQHKTTKQYIALKFFGYVPKRVNLMELYHEFELFAAVNNLNGVVQLYGYGVDPPNGYIQNKIYKISYPIICMEYLQGGDLFDRIQSYPIISENDIVMIIRNLINSLSGLHQKGYVHGDIKLENIMFTSSQKDDFHVKFIDFGMMIQLPPGRDVYTSSTIHGTPGYVAPESIKYGQYSFQSDVWQVGCVLYSLLSGFQAFNPNTPQQILHGKFQPMTGIGWDNISEDAKDLVKKIFILNPKKRITCEGILQHPWVHNGIASTADLGGNYHKRIKHLALGQTLKKVFQDRDIVQVTSDTKEKLRRILPLLVQDNKKKIRRTKSNIIRPSLSSLLRTSPTIAPPITPSTSSIPLSLPPQGVISFNKKYSTPSIFVHASPTPQPPTPKLTRESMTAVPFRAYSQDDIDLLRMTKRRTQGEEEEKETVAAEKEWRAKMALLKTAFVQHAVGRKRPSLKSSGCPTLPDDQSSVGGEGSTLAEEHTNGEINFEGFMSLLHECDLPELATPQMFHIFGMIPQYLCTLFSPSLTM